MKSGKKPTREQRKSIEYSRLNSDNWLVHKNLNDELHLIHRETGTIRKIPK